MEKVFMQKFYPGITFPETCDIDITEGGLPEFVDNGCYAYRLFKRTMSGVDGEVLMGDKRDYSGVVFLGAKTYTLDDIKHEFPHEKILISNMECNGWNLVVKTRQGQFVNFYPERGDKIQSCMLCDEGLKINVFDIKDVLNLGEDVFII